MPASLPYGEGGHSGFAANPSGAGWGRAQRARASDTAFFGGFALKS